MQLPEEYKALSEEELFVRIAAAKTTLGADLVILGHHYQRHEVKLVRAIRQLLYVDGFTISGARTKLENIDVKAVESGKPTEIGTQSRQLISQVIKELDEVVSMLQ